MMRMMSRRLRQQFALWIGTALIFGSAVIAYRGVAQVARFSPPLRSTSATSRPAQPERAGPHNLAALWKRNLRQPLADAPQAAPVAVAEAQLPIQLIGTAIESQRRFGVFSVSNRSFIREVGSEIEGYRVAAIERGSARLQRAERIVELRVPWYEKLQRSLEQSGARP